MVIIVVNGKKSICLEQIIKMSTFHPSFCLGNIFNKFDNVDVEEVSLKANVYDFLADYDAIDKPETLNIYKYLMIRNNIK